VEYFEKVMPVKKIMNEKPFRAELFSMDQFELHAKFLAGKHAVSSKNVREKLLVRLKDNEEMLLRVNKLLNEAAKAKRIITPAGDWLLDNYYLIEEQIRLAQKFLPKGYSRELPWLSKGPMAGFPRIYDIAMEVVSHGDGRLDVKRLTAFVSSYQTVTHLKLGELWGIPIMLRLALIENLRRVSVNMMLTQIDRNRADYWAGRILGVAARDTNSYIREIAAMAKDDPPMSDSFVSEFVRKLQGQSAAIDLPLIWMEKKLLEQGETIDRMIRSTGQKQAANQVSIANTIESLRLLEGTNWHDFVEGLSVVESVLKQDPAGVYPLMSFDTRDRYRHMIEKIALQSGLSEEEVASKAVRIASQAPRESDGRDAAAHIGYYLIDGGLEQFYRSLGVRLPWDCYLKAKKTLIPLVSYMGSIILFTCAATVFITFFACNLGLRGWMKYILLVIPLLFMTSQTVIAIVNTISTILVKPENLPKLDFSKGIPAGAHTLVVVPAMLGSGGNISSLIENMEVSYLANMDASVDFALLTDLQDAKQEIMPDDEVLLSKAAAGIEKLNEKYRRSEGEIFYLFHRGRKWNAGEKIWMGYERKRGKLSALNMLLRGAGKESFRFIKGDTDRLQDVKYVLTLDTDTRMPRDAVKDLASVIAHPLNRPLYDENKGRVTAGYGILQPRVESGYPGEDPSLFVKIFGGETGIDPYTKAVSDVYQDLFFEGSFIGKGLYDVDVFEKCLKDRLPENLILSHDMLEGCYARSALVTDVELHEKYPAGYLKDVSRRRRWMRGDWQITHWLFSNVPGFDGVKKPNPLSFLSQWKILDNLRRSLVSASTVILFLLGWGFFRPSWAWTILIILIAGLPVPLKFIFDIIKKPEDISLEAHLNVVLSSLAIHTAQFCLSITFIIYEACFSLEAVIKTFWRKFVTHSKLLEWNTSAETELIGQKTIFNYYKKMIIAPFFVLLLFAAGRVPADIPAAILMALWMLSPAAACVISRPSLTRRASLPEAKSRFLRQLARRTWNFFEDFVTARDNYLPPDNFQEEPSGAVAHRTSPTNIGLSLLSNMTAYDMGYVSMGLMLKRTKNTLDTMNRLERFRGHFYNWYNTETLKPLFPLYISSVDSGNLTGHLLVLRSGLAEMRDEKILSLKIFDGFSDTLDILEESLPGDGSGRTAAEQDAVNKTRVIIRNFREKLALPPESFSEIYIFLRRLSEECAKMLSGLELEGPVPARKWARSFEAQCYDHLEDIIFIAPWVLLEIEIPGIRDNGGEKQKQRLILLREELRRLDNIPSINDTARLELKLIPMIDEITDNIEPAAGSDAAKEWFISLKEAFKSAGSRVSERIALIEEMRLSLFEMSDVEYDFLYNKTKHLFSIGYNVGERKADPSCYDILASESRLASYVSIAQGKVPQEHWFMLGRLLSKRGGDPVLMSWGGSMFEYLMPLLVMPDYEGTLLDMTYKAVISRQIDYARRNGVSWGISESCYNKMDTAMTYQYRSFGVPDSGFKRGLSEDLVIAPYASALALMVDPEKACLNLEHLSEEGFKGEYGFYEAIDYTPSRLAVDETYAVIKSYMAHHQGMSFLSFAYVLLDRPMQRRFLAEPMFRATELLMQERVPADVPFLYDAEITGPLRKIEERETLLRVFTNPDTPTPEIHLLSNGKYNVMVTNSGAGYSRWRDIAVTRWREDASLDNEGTFIYLRDIDSGEFWSTAYQPTLKKSKKYEAVFSQSRAEFKRRDHHIETHTEIAVSPEDDIELRRVTVTNRSHNTRIIELTSYAEAVVNHAEADIAHASFSNLFVQTEIIRPYQAIICGRRPRSDKDSFPFMLHLMAVHGNSVKAASYETNRGKFIGRCGVLTDPAAMHDSGSLTDSEGPVLDPIVSIRCTIELGPQELAVIDYVTGICGSRDEAQKLMEKYRDRNLADRVFSLAWTHGQVALQQINATEADAQLYGRLASAIVYANPAWRAAASVLKKNLRGQPDLWGYSISGDLPVVLVRIENTDNIGLIAQMVQAHSYWRMKGLAVDLVIWNEDHSVYRDAMSEKINGLISQNNAALSNRPGGIFLRRADQMSEEDKILIQTVARIIITDRGGTLADQIERVAHIRPQRPQFIQRPSMEPLKILRPEKDDAGLAQRGGLIYFNGLGGFTRDGREYVINTDRSKKTPAPWANVLANKDFGTVISESGGAYTWSENAHEFRITPWKNDPVTDTSGEAIYIRDEESGRFWSPTPLPAGGKTRYISRHGFGYSVFEHEENGLATELTVFVSLDMPVKFSVLKIKNISGRRRSLSATSYNELVMGNYRDKYHMHIITEVDPKSGAMFAYNHYNKEFQDRVVFFDVSEAARFVSGDRNEFLGRNGTMAAPAALQRDRLSGKTGAGLDPCGCMQVMFELNDGDEKEVIFTMGSGKSPDGARSILQRFSSASLVHRELENVWEYWKRSLGVIYVETPDDSVNFLVNGWLQYQTISCRLWGRSGYYQSGGAYGFRDQLQDAMSLTHSHPEMIRELLLSFASHQFTEGDVQHWWHPPSGKGTRTSCSDDYLWLPLVTCLYIEEIGDTGILDETVQFLEGPLLKPGEESYYDMPGISEKKGTLYEHCAAAVRHSLRFGVHGLPLMGSGDWNDGMNLVGKDGKGESVWLAFFMHMVLTLMGNLAEKRGDTALSQECAKEVLILEQNIEKNGWDGKWYLRAYFDNGDPVGSSSNTECRIDSIPQSWSVISGAGVSDRAREAMDSVDSLLVDRKNSLIKLFDPPFDRCAVNPGYIKGYTPGVRENGGQYTHAAVWAVMAFAILKDRKKAWELLDIINPIRHCDTEDKCAVYKVEPYVMAADIYGAGPNTGRGGWTWYTGSASWMYQLMIKHLLGVRLKVDRLYFKPCLPEKWQSFKLHYRYRETFYHITVKRSGAGDNVLSVTVDGSANKDMCVPLVDDRAEHTAEVMIG
jgi:cellobiose phosphorylase